MKGFLILISTILLYLLISFPINAQWTKYPQNPVIPVTPHSWYSIHAAGPTVLYENGQFKMWFQGHDGTTFAIGSATSVDGINWNVSTQPQITVSSPGLTNGIEVVEPMVIKNGSIYQMWFKEYILGENRIRYAMSSNDNDWTINPQPVFTKSQNAWEATGPTNPSILFENNEYKMWYVAAGNTSSWKIGFATSSDGINWVRYSNDPLNIPSLGLVGGPTVIKINNQYHMWYHTGNNANTNIYHIVSTDGINWTCDGNCSVLQIEGNSFDSGGMIAPTVLEQNGKLYLWYAGSNGINWQIELATFNLPVTPTPTNIPTPTPTSEPTPIPTPQVKIPVIIIPGFMASWNKEAILHNKPSIQSDWKLASFVKEYNGIIESFKNIGYKENENLFVFTYDWRKNLESIADDLQVFLQNNIWSRKDTKINIVGHSLGGLVGRIWAQKFNQDLLNVLVTAGTPHKGTAQVYKAVEAGELDKSNSFLWLAEKTILVLNKDSFETDKETIRSVFPIITDLFPTYDFLKKQDNTYIPVSSLQIQNNLLNTYNQSLQGLYPQLHTFSGERANTLFGFTISNRTMLDQLLNLYLDGKPLTNLNEIGDYIILSSSATVGNNTHILNNGHSELIYAKESIKNILDSLSIPYQDNLIVEGEETKISSSLIFYLRSPAEMMVLHNGNTYPEQDGVIFIPNAQSGDYQVKITGKEPGRYSLVIGQIGENNNLWNIFEGKIRDNDSTGQTDTYVINFHSASPVFPLPPSKTLFEELVLYLRDLNNSSLNKPIYSIQTAEGYFIKNKWPKLQDELISAHKELFQAFKKSKSQSSKKQILTAIEKLEYLYQQSLSNYNYKLFDWKLKLDLFLYEKRFELLQRMLLTRKPKNNLVLVLQSIDQKLKLAKDNYIRNKPYADILLRSIHELLQEFNVR